MLAAEARLMLSHAFTGWQNIASEAYKQPLEQTVFRSMWVFAMRWYSGCSEGKRNIRSGTTPLDSSQRGNVPGKEDQLFHPHIQNV